MSSEQQIGEALLKMHVTGSLASTEELSLIDDYCEQNSTTPADLMKKEIKRLESTASGHGKKVEKNTSK